MKLIVRISSLVSLIILLCHCAPTRFVEPLDKGQKAVGFNFGGPVIGFAGAKIPIPFTSLYGGYGYSDKLTLFGGIHLTAAAYKNLQLDLGASSELFSQKGFVPAIGANGALHWITAFPSLKTRVFPQFDLFTRWDYATKWQTYLGSSLWLDFYKSVRQSKKTYRPAIFNFYIGQSYKPSGKWRFTFEYKLLAPDIPNDRSVVDYVHWSSKGAQGIYLSAVYLF